VKLIVKDKVSVCILQTTFDVDISCCWWMFSNTAWCNTFHYCHPISCKATWIWFIKKWKEWHM